MMSASEDKSNSAEDSLQFLTEAEVAASISPTSKEPLLPTVNPEATGPTKPGMSLPVNLQLASPVLR